MAARRIVALLLLPWLGLLPWPWARGGLAASPPVCTAADAGIVACIAGRLCRCGYERGGSMLDRPAGYRWDCGVLRPYCHRPPASQPRHDVLDELRLYVPLPEVRPAVPPPHRPSGRPKPIPPS